jgi:hypothetical protein
MMAVNNYYTPKLYELTNSNYSEITVWFKDAYGNKVPIRAAHTPDNEILETYQAVFKIECELALIKNK